MLTSCPGSAGNLCRTTCLQAVYAMHGLMARQQHKISTPAPLECHASTSTRHKRRQMQ